MKVGAVLGIVIGLGVAWPAAAQISPVDKPITFLARGGNTLVMMTEVPERPVTGQVDTWVWYFFGPDHAESSERGALTRAVRLTIDCATRRTRNEMAETFNGPHREGWTSLAEHADWVRPGETSIGAAPIKAACDPAPATPRVILPNFAAARSGADRALLVPPSGS